MTLTLVRFAYLRDVTLGYLFTDNGRFATLEEPWIENPFGPGGQRKGVGLCESCVPDGTYALEPHNGVKKQNVWALVNRDLGVTHGLPPPGQPFGRSAILIHSGNTVLDSEGCILVGLAHGLMDGRNAVLSSRPALDKLRLVLGRQEHELKVRPTTGTTEVTQWSQVTS
jgi:hypothetical protein